MRDVIFNKYSTAEKAREEYFLMVLSDNCIMRAAADVCCPESGTALRFSTSTLLAARDKLQLGNNDI